ncbi:Fc.00g061050.m01.CDS01 [Cosmosporella sp. VM-42]
MAPQSQVDPTPRFSSEAAGTSSRTSVTSESHDIQLRYKLAPPTFKTLCTIPKSPCRQDVLKKACFATEFRSFPIKQAEKGFLREIHDHTGIPYQIGEAISQPWHKVFLIVQVNLLGTAWPGKLSGPARKDLNRELGRMYNLLDKVLRCLVDILGERNDGKGLNTALDVLRSVKAGVWEGSEKQLLQVEGIGPVKLDRLLKAGIKNIKQLSNLEFYHIERLMSRNPPFGQQMLHQLAGFPILTLESKVLGQYPQSIPDALASQATSLTACSDVPAASSTPLWIVRVILGFQNKDVPSWNRHRPWATFVIEGDDGRLVWFWRGSVKRLVGGKEMVIGLSAGKGEVLKLAFACEEIVGTIIRETLQI